MMRTARETLFRALRDAGGLILRGFDKPQKIAFKKGSPINLVTAVDQAADARIRRILRRAFPTHDLLTEESEPTTLHSPYRWIVDPLDGTTNYAHNFPQACVSIGLEHRALSPTLSRATRERGNNHDSLARYDSLARRQAGEGWGEGTILLGGVYDPFRDELFWAERGKGAWLEHAGKKKRLRVSPTSALKRSLLLTGFPYDRRERIDLYLSYIKAFMHRIQGIRRAGAAALDLCWVACGRVDGYWEWRLKPWDCAAGQIIVEEAGGRLSDFSGRPFSVYGEQTLATNGRVHAEMLRVMRGLLR